MRTLTLAFILFGASLSALAQAPIIINNNTLDINQKKTLRLILQSFLSSQKLAGLTVAATVDNRVIWSEGVGLANKASETPLNKNIHALRWASVSKVYNHAIAEWLDSLGALDLDAPINQYYSHKNNLDYYRRCFSAGTLKKYFDCRQEYGSPENLITAIRGTCFDVRSFAQVETNKGFRAQLRDISASSGRLIFGTKEGKVKCEANYSIKVEQLKSTDPQMTTRQLLSHTGGIQHYSYLGNNAQPPNNMINNVQAIRTRRNQKKSYMEYAISTFFPKHPLLTKPGLAYKYTTFGHNLAGVIIEKASAMPYQELMKQFAGRMGTPSFQVDLLKTQATGGFRIAHVHTMENGKLVNNPYNTDNSYKVAGGGIISTIVDLGKFCAALATPKYFTNNGWGVYNHSGSHAKRSAAHLTLNTRNGQRQCLVLMTNTNHGNVDLPTIRNTIRTRLENWGYFEE
jgi:CubicO group peptidase (beta-lactamase class C family)